MNRSLPSASPGPALRVRVRESERNPRLRESCQLDSLETDIGRRTENAGFTCAYCDRTVPPLSNGSYRNHCPACLRSLHVDQVPGDRASGCGGVMRPVALRNRPAKGWQLVHRCERCGAIRVNRVAADTVAPDDLDALLALPPDRDA